MLNNHIFEPKRLKILIYINIRGIFAEARLKSNITDKNVGIIHVGDDFDLDYVGSIESDANFKPILLLNDDKDMKKFNVLKEKFQMDQNNVAFNLRDLLEMLLNKKI
jgi:hypothetical protein